jgi:hypothetical protein
VKASTYRSFLVLWAKAQDQPGYDLREWVRLHDAILALEARLALTRATLADALVAEAARVERPGSGVLPT